MKYHKIVISALAALALLPGCATWCATGTGDGDPNYLKLLACSLVTPTPKPPADPGYTVTQGQRQERTFAAPCSVAFSITMGRDGSPATEDVAVWAVASGGDWNGGNPATFGVRVNAYNADTWKLKVYNADGTFAGELKLASPWRAGGVYAVRLDVFASSVRLTVDGRSVEVVCQVSPEVTLGIGWPPQQRSGAVGAVLRGIMWSGQP